MKKKYYILNENLEFVEEEVHIVSNKLRPILHSFMIGAVTLLFLFFYGLLELENTTQKYTKLTTLLENENKLLKEELRFCGNQSLMVLSTRHVDTYIDQLPFANKELIKKQYRLESGNLKSQLAKQCNNLFGMKTSKRKHTYIGVGKDNYVIYGHWTLSVIDRLLYEIYVGTSLKGYAEDSNYLQKLK